MDIKMKVLVCKEPNVLEYKTVSKPLIEKGEALIKMKALGICGTDIHAYLGRQAFFTYPRVLGHEISASIVEIDDEKSDLKPGDNVIVIPYVSCGKCIACRKGRSNCCTSLNVYGVHSDGGMGEYMTVPTDYLIKLENLNPVEMALIEPLAISAHAAGRVKINEGDFVLVAGAGPIGLGVAEFARINKAEVIVVDINDDRLNFIRERFDYKYLLNPLNAGYKEKIYEITRGDLPDIIFDTTGSKTSMENSIKLLSHGGTLIYVGIYKGDLEINDIEFHKRETTLLGSRGARKEDFNYVIECIRNKKIAPKKFITHSADFDAAKEKFEMWVKPESKVFKAVIEF